VKSQRAEARAHSNHRRIRVERAVSPQRCTTHTGSRLPVPGPWIGDIVAFKRRDSFGTATDIWRISVSGTGQFVRLSDDM
jgi:hypothetical protein